MNDRPEIAVEPGTKAETSRFTPSRPENATQAVSVSFLDSTGLVVYGSTASPFASCRRTCSNPSAVIVALPIRWAASCVRCCSLLVESDAAWAMLFAPISTRPKNRETPAGMPWIVSTGSVTRLTTASTGLAAAFPAA